MRQSFCISEKNEQKIIASYIRDVNKQLIATRTQKRRLVDDLKNDIRQHIADGKIAGYDDIVAYFGTPEQVAKDFFATADIKEIKKKLFRKRIVILAIVVCLLLFCGYVAATWYDGLNGLHYYVTETLEVDGSVVYEDVLVEDNRHDKTQPLPHRNQ